MVQIVELSIAGTHVSTNVRAASVRRLHATARPVSLKFSIVVSCFTGKTRGMDLTRGAQPALRLLQPSKLRGRASVMDQKRGDSTAVQRDCHIN